MFGYKIIIKKRDYRMEKTHFLSPFFPISWWRWISCHTDDSWYLCWLLSFFFFHMNFPSVSIITLREIVIGRGAVRNSSAIRLLLFDRWRTSLSVLPSKSWSGEDEEHNGRIGCQTQDCDGVKKSRFGRTARWTRESFCPICSTRPTSGTEPQIGSDNHFT